VVVVETGVAVVWLTVVVVATGVDVVLLKWALIQHLTILYQPRIGGTYVGPVVVVVPVVVPLGRLPYTNCEPSNNGMLETRWLAVVKPWYDQSLVGSQVPALMILNWICYNLGSVKGHACRFLYLRKRDRISLFTCWKYCWPVY
jgi:hypothetical protein